MQEGRLRLILEYLYQKKLSPEEALEKLRHLPYEDLGFAKVDHHRPLRKGFPEVIYCPGKTTEQIIAIMEKLKAWSGNILATRADAELFRKLQKHFPDAYYNNLSRTIVIHRDHNIYGWGTILVISAGTSDIPVAEEAYVTAQVMGNRVEKLYDVGVAGIHRLLDNSPMLYRASVIIVVAGMEGALASVVGGLVSCPIIAVPTSTGYGANFSGLAPLLTMLNSCAAGVSVVNIDNGFGAGYSASLINRVALKKPGEPQAEGKPKPQEVS